MCGALLKRCRHTGIYVICTLYVKFHNSALKKAGADYCTPLMFSDAAPRSALANDQAFLASAGKNMVNCPSHRQNNENMCSLSTITFPHDINRRYNKKVTTMILPTSLAFTAPRLLCLSRFTRWYPWINQFSFCISVKSPPGPPKVLSSSTVCCRSPQSVAVVRAVGKCHSGRWVMLAVVGVPWLCGIWSAMVPMKWPTILPLILESGRGIGIRCGT